MFLIADITLAHDFYPGGVWREASLVPDAPTQEWMHRFGLQLTAAGNHWRLFGSAMTGRTAFLNYCSLLDATRPFRFWLMQPQSWLLAVTDLSADWKGVIGLCSGDVEGDGVLRIGPPVTGAVPVGAFAQISLMPVDVVTQQAFTLRLPARATLWQYRLIPHGQKRVQNLHVVDTGGQVSFSDPATQPGESGWVTSSTTPIVLQQMPSQRFSLIEGPRTETNSGRPRQQRIITVLPTPATDSLFTAYSADRQPVSVMYVYV